MVTELQAIRGMNDILPSGSSKWLALEKTMMRLAQSYGYQHIRMPIVEKTELFYRSIGDATDIVEKEMYSFVDALNGEKLTLRPEGTAGCARAVIQHSLAYGQAQKLWYMGPVFRHERPQKGRYRQFHQFGMETFGIEGPEIDAELIFFCARLWKILGISNALTLEINSLGSATARQSYRALLVAYFSQHIDKLDEDSLRRLKTNPLRILDSKNPKLQTLIAKAPSLIDCIDESSKAHFDTLCDYLNHANIEYRINPRLVRGLDYYNRTVFEWVTDKLGSQGTVCAGGRYDGLVKQIGGKDTTAVGFAAGVERLLELMETMNIDIDKAKHHPDIYLILLGDRASHAGLLLAESLHDQLPHLKIVTNCSGGSVKSQFKRADRSGARFALILGDNELEQQYVTLKYLREASAQRDVHLDDLVNTLKALIP